MGKSGSEGRGEQTTARKRGIGGSPLTLLPDSPIPRRRKGQSAGTTPDTGATLCRGIVEGPLQPPERGALPSEGNQGDEWDAYVVLGRMTGTNAGSPAGREPHGDGVPIVVVGVTTHQGGRESRPQGDMPRAAYRPPCCAKKYVALHVGGVWIGGDRARWRDIFIVVWLEAFEERE